jgi:hypothetical protein
MSSSLQLFDDPGKMKQAAGSPNYNPPMTDQSEKYGRQQMPFMAFGGPIPPERVVEYMRGNTEHYNVNNTFAEPGGYKFKYDLIWNGERQIYDPTNAQKDRQMYNMTMAPKSSGKEHMSGAIILKEGETKCTPGYTLKNGQCVMENTNVVCQPGWVKQNGVCVKAPREFMQGSYGTATAAQMYPEDKADVLSLTRLRSYMQEKAEGEATTQGEAGNASAMIIGIFLGLACFLVLFWMSNKKKTGD